MFLWFSTQFLCSKHTLTRTAHQHTYTAIRICVAWLAVDMLIVLHFNRHQRRRRRWWWRWCTRGPKKTKPINENVLKCCVYAGVTVLCNELKRIDTAKATTTTKRKQTIHENNNNALVNHHRSKYIHTTRYYIIKWSEMKWNDLCWTCTHLFFAVPSVVFVCSFFVWFFATVSWIRAYATRTSNTMKTRVSAFSAFMWICEKYIWLN